MADARDGNGVSSHCCDRIVVIGPARAPARRRTSHRLRGAWVFTICGAILALAAWLTPNPRGCGTHTQLGMPACSFLVRTGLPCPTCGLTTSMSLMVRGRVVGAFEAHPFGVVLFCGVAVLFVAAAVELATGRDTIGRLRPTVWWGLLALAGTLAGWGWKLLTGFLSGELPMR